MTDACHMDDDANDDDDDDDDDYDNDDNDDDDDDDDADNKDVDDDDDDDDDSEDDDDADDDFEDDDDNDDADDNDDYHDDDDDALKPMKKLQLQSPRSLLFSKRERKTLFRGLKWTTVKFYNLPNYFCLGLYLTVFWRCPSSESDVNVSNDPGKLERSFFGFVAMCSPHIGMF